MQGIAYKIGKALGALSEFAMIATSFVNIAGCATTKENVDKESTDWVTKIEDMYTAPEDSPYVCKRYIHSLQLGETNYEVYELENMLSNCKRDADASSDFFMCLYDEITEENRIGAELESAYVACQMEHLVSKSSDEHDSPSSDPAPEEPPAPTEKPAPTPPAASDKADAAGGEKVCRKAAGGSISGPKEKGIYDTCMDMVEVCMNSSPPITLSIDVGPVSFDSVEKCIEKSGKLAAMGYKLE